MNAFFIGEFANVSWKILEDGMEWQKRLDDVNLILFYLELPFEQAEEVRKFLFQTEKLKQKQEEVEVFFGDLSIKQIMKVQNYVCSKIISKNFVVGKLID